MVVLLHICLNLMFLLLSNHASLQQTHNTSEKKNHNENFVVLNFILIHSSVHTDVSPLHFLMFLQFVVYTQLIIAIEMSLQNTIVNEFMSLF